jgi:protein ImuB
MLWVALHFPQFRRQALSRGHALPEPERDALAAIAAWACQFTPRVSLEPPHAMLLEVEGSLRHFGSRWQFLARLRRGLTGLGFEAHLGEAPTARAALWLARAGGGNRRIESLPVAVLELEAPQLELLAGLGIGTLGGLLRLPRDGIARRFGMKLLDELDRARGAAAESRRYFLPPSRFAARLELPAEISQADSALFAARRLLEELEGFLAARHAGVSEFFLDLEHEGVAATRVCVKLNAPARDKEHFTRLLRERLGARALKAAVQAICLSAERLVSMPGSDGHLLRDPRAGGEEWLRLIERLQARLGPEAVHGLDTQEDHRPERAFRSVAFELKGPNAGEKKKDGGPERTGARPLWLLESPRPIAKGEFALLAGPERIEAGWWGGGEARRDYFIARTRQCSLAWIYRERAHAEAQERQEDWFLHGFFA